MTATNLSNKLVLENVNGETGKKSRYTFGKLTQGMATSRLLALAGYFAPLREKATTNIYRVEDTQLSA